MKPFEEQYTAWVDGRLEGAELAEFENALPERSAAEADKLALGRLQHLLREHGQTPALTNVDFFSHQLQQRIAAEEPAETRPEPARAWAWPATRLAWIGASCLLVAAALYYTNIPRHTHGDEPFMAEILTTEPADPSIHAKVVYAPEERLTVIWLEGLEYLPASYTLDQ